MPSLLAGIGALALYLLLAPPAVGDKDAAEFTLVLAARGVAHPTGYPLYTLFGHPFVSLLHACGVSWAYAANAWSALGGAVAIALLHRLARQLTAGRPGGALLSWLPVLLFGLNPVWTFETTLAETGSWHVAWSCGAALLALRLFTKLDAPVAAAFARRDAALWGLVCGLGLAHHATALLPAAILTAALAIAARRRGLSWGLLPPALAGLLLPLAAYGFVAWRAFHPGAVQWPLLSPSWGSVFDHLRAAQYREFFGRFQPSAGQARLLAVHVYPFLALSALALVAAIRASGPGPRRRLLQAVAAACVLECAVTFSYGVPDPTSYFLPVLALGLVATAHAAARLRVPTARRGRAAAGALLVLALLAVATPWLRTGWQRRVAYVRHEQLLRKMWESVTAERGFLLWADDMSFRLRAWQILDGEKPGLVVVNPALLTHPWPRREFARIHGFDPLQGVALPRPGQLGSPQAGRILAELVDGAARSIGAQSDLPVFVFDPSGPSVRQLRKPAAAPTSVAPSSQLSR
ncbi:MAG: DUF2723 domain-containing protein [bacterium]|nr:DUF2723 domain-containing protein [bacterium]